MRYENDTRQLKFEVLKNTARYAFAGTLDQHADQIPYDIIQGNIAKYRCCVYKEREIIRERMQLAQGKRPSTGEACLSGIVSVIPAACEGCPINRYTVTENCQRCVAKPCRSTCPFGAIHMGNTGAYIDHTECRECGKCVSSCPYNAISDTLRPCIRSCPTNAISTNEHKQAIIKYDKCISCGTCTVSCPFGAISDSSPIIDVVAKILDKSTKVYAIFAPAIEGQFGTASVGMIKSALKMLGFDDTVEVALGADAVSDHEADELIRRVRSGEKMTTSCCPAFVTLIQKRFPELADKIPDTVSPMTATARYVRAKFPGSIAVFIGPCVAKKHEATKVPDSADYVLTFEELAAMFSAKDIDPIKMPMDTEDAQDGSRWGRGFAVSGGVGKAISEALVEKGFTDDIKIRICDGAGECKKALSLMVSDKLVEDIIEGMTCINGCVAGPAVIAPYLEVMKNRTLLAGTTDNRSVTENVAAHDFSDIKMGPV